MNEPSPLKTWPDIPTRVLLCRDNRPLPADWLRGVVKERVGITPDEIDGGHCIALSRPRNLPIDSMASFRSDMRSGLWLPLFEELADPGVVARLGAEAEEAGWHGVFVWDQLRWRAPIRQVADPWITLTAVAAATEKIKLGPMVTPLARRRPAKVARETATLDRLSGGRLILGVGLGGDQFAGEFSKTGEQLDDRLRAEMLDEALEILLAAWSGEPVNHLGKHYLIDDVQFLLDRCNGREYQCGLRRSRERQAAAQGSALRRLLPGQPRRCG